MLVLVLGGGLRDDDVSALAGWRVGYRDSLFSVPKRPMCVFFSLIYRIGLLDTKFFHTPRSSSLASLVGFQAIISQEAMGS